MKISLSEVLISKIGVERNFESLLVFLEVIVNIFLLMFGCERLGVESSKSCFLVQL